MPRHHRPHHEPADRRGHPLIEGRLLGGRWASVGLVLLPACGRPAPEPGLPPRSPPRAAGSSEIPDFDRHLARLREERLPPGFALTVEPPFVVVGDLRQEELESWAEGTVRWAVRLLRQDYFDRDPLEIIDVWLFQDDASYRKHTWEIFGDRPSTRFGYYSARHGALLMNISTGGGTLVHEIVHPFVRANFERCPTWLNEGLGSLYEACSEQDGHIVGRVNWRLAGLQKCIDEGRLPPFRWLFQASDEEFYGGARGDPYGQARYLCLWLEQQGLLRPFWRRILRDQESDPTGEATLRAILGREDLDAFQRRWQEWVFTLRP